MSDVLIRVEGRAGRITLNRPQALNAVTWDMIREIHAALKSWAGTPKVRLVIIDAAGDRRGKAHTEADRQRVKKRHHRLGQSNRGHR